MARRSSRQIRVNIGGEEEVDGWQNVNLLPDFFGITADARNLPFLDRSVDVIYASHVLCCLEHNGPNLDALREWFRVLRHDGRIYVSVPNLRVICECLLTSKSQHEEMEYVRHIYGDIGGLFNAYHSGYSPRLLQSFLMEAGFDHIKEVPSFGFFNDRSVARIAGRSISINMEAKK